ncbi:hypothetical protein [Bacillus solitudinis]|uniref:hypothetical protein n=1 Tax=Bacillus solitudinis TaxID=2014074 RepID=UPI000C2472C0|nr:hypothetical protein [Bacillus solitudinis]
MRMRILDFFKDWFFKVIIGFVILFIVIGTASLFGYSGFWERGLNDNRNIFLLAISLVISWIVVLWIKENKKK